MRITLRVTAVALVTAALLTACATSTATNTTAMVPCNVAQDASTPPTVTGTTKVTTPAFTPPNNSLLVALLPLSATKNPAPVITDTARHAWTLRKAAWNTHGAGAYIYTAQVITGSRLAVTGTGSTGSVMLAVRVITGGQLGGASSSALLHGRALSHGITTTVPGSQVLIAADATGLVGAKPNSLTASIKGNTAHNATGIAGQQKSPTLTPGAETLGWSLTTTAYNAFVAVEVTPASCPAPTHVMTMGPSAACLGGAGQGCTGDPGAYPLGGTVCADTVNPAPERIPANALPDNLTGPVSTAAANYGPWVTNPVVPMMTRDIAAATGQYTGTTDEILEWAACEEGWDENWARAEAYVESSWRQGTTGDIALGCPQSFGILQVRDGTGKSCTPDHDAWGGYPLTSQSTAFAAEFQMAYLRACFDGLVTYLYPQTVVKMAADNGWTYVAWGCVGSWFSGDWYSTAAQGYITAVQQALAAQTWNSL